LPGAVALADIAGEFAREFRKSARSPTAAVFTAILSAPADDGVRALERSNAAACVKGNGKPPATRKWFPSVDDAARGRDIEHHEAVEPSAL
jgi:hypothetical protein